MTYSTLQSPNSVSRRISGWGSLTWHLLLTSSCSMMRMLLDCVELLMSAADRSLLSSISSKDECMVSISVGLITLIFSLVTELINARHQQ